MLTETQKNTELKFMREILNDANQLYNKAVKHSEKSKVIYVTSGIEGVLYRLEDIIIKIEYAIDNLSSEDDLNN